MGAWRNKLEETEARARGVVGLLGLVGFGVACRLGLTLYVLIALGGMSSRDVSWTRGLSDLFQVLPWLELAVNFVSVLLAVFFLMWVHSAHALAGEVGRATERVEPLTAVLAYLLPVVFFVLPWVHMRKLARAADPSDLPPRSSEIAGLTKPAPFIAVSAWWLLGLAHVALAVTLRVTASPVTPEEAFARAYQAVLFALLDGLLLLACAGLAASMVLGLTRSLKERAARLGAYAAPSASSTSPRDSS